MGDALGSTVVVPEEVEGQHFPPGHWGAAYEAVVKEISRQAQTANLEGFNNQFSKSTENSVEKSGGGRLSQMYKTCSKHLSHFTALHTWEMPPTSLPSSYCIST
jgi:hypothetical protein